MSRTCRQLRDALTSTGRLPDELAVHLEECADCASFAERARIARQLFKDHHADVVPDASFAARVATRLEQEEPQAELGRAAARLIPASLVLLFVLAWMAWRAEANPESLVVESPVDSPLSWAIADPGDDS